MLDEERTLPGAVEVEGVEVKFSAALTPDQEIDPERIERAPRAEPANAPGPVLDAQEDRAALALLADAESMTDPPAWQAPRQCQRFLAGLITSEGSWSS